MRMKHSRLLKKKRIIEVAIATGILLFVMLVVSLITPYAPKSDLYFHEGASTNESILYRAKVEAVNDKELQATIQDGPRAGTSTSVSIEHYRNAQKFTPGSIVILGESAADSTLVLIDKFRIPALILLVTVFALIVLLVGRRKGLKSLLGLAASILVITFILLPLVLSGFDAFYASILASVLIAVVTVIFAQGFTRRALIIFMSIMIILLFVAVTTSLIVSALGLTGQIDDASYFISTINSGISLSGLVTGGIVIATLGAVDDIVTTQTATVDELMETDKKLGTADVFSKASRVGVEHISSLVNTLVLVYVGAALPLIVVNILSKTDTFYFFNSEFIATEVVRTIIVSIGLVLAVPLSTLLAAKFLRS